MQSGNVNLSGKADLALQRQIWQLAENSYLLKALDSVLGIIYVWPHAKIFAPCTTLKWTSNTIANWPTWSSREIVPEWEPC